MLTKVVSLEIVPSFKLALRFSDGAGGVHDCSALVGSARGAGVLLRDPVYFARARLDHGAPTWPNGFDMDPEWLRREMQAAGELRPAVAAG